MRLLLSFLAAAVGSSYALVDFSNSTLYDRFDFARYQLPVPKCKSGCVIYAATPEATVPNGTYPAFAKNFIVYNTRHSIKITNVLEIAKQVDANKKKIPFTINGPAEIAIVNMNENYNGEPGAQSFVLYVVEKAIADSIPSEVYDVAETNELKPQTEIVTLLSTQAYKLKVSARTEKFTVRLAGFDNARDGNKDECVEAYTSEGSEFSYFELVPNTPILSLASNGKTQAKIRLEKLRPEFFFSLSGPEGFITSPGWNGCRKPKSGGIQTFRTNDYEHRFEYSVSTAIFDALNFTLFPNLDSTHNITMWDADTEITTVVDGFVPKEFIGLNGFLLRYKKYKKLTSTTNAMPPATTTVAAPVEGRSENYCNCAIKEGWFDNWDPTGIWVDLVIIIDTSTSMGDRLEEVQSVVSSFVSLMSTDTSSDFYSRIGVIAASNEMKTVYNLNMTSSDSLDLITKSNVTQIDVEAALNAARQMFADGAKDPSYRPNAKQIVYYLTSSVPPVNLNEADEFKSGGGIIMVNGFNVNGTNRQSFINLASPNFFFTDLTENYLNNLGVLCEANCFCDASKQAFNDITKSPRTQANRGCFTPFNQGIPQQKARERCTKSGGTLVSIHDDKKELFVNKVASSLGPNKKYWLGLQNDGKVWIWDDKSTDPYTNWDAKQPNTNDGKLKCAYAAMADNSVKWTAAN